MIRYYFDTEFDGHNGPLLSLGIVRQDGVSLYLRTTEVAQDPWVVEHVMPIMDSHEADAHYTVELNQVGPMLRAYLGTQPFKLITDSPVDIGRFCQALTTGLDGQWQSTGFESIEFSSLNVDCYPTDLPNAVQHNSWWDARALWYLLENVEEPG